MPDHNHNSSHQIVFLEYKFMFDPSETFAHLFEFDQAMGRAFGAMGFEVEIIKGVEGQGLSKIFFIKKKKEIETPNSPTIPKKLTKPKV